MICLICGFFLEFSFIQSQIFRPLFHLVVKPVTRRKPTVSPVLANPSGDFRCGFLPLIELLLSPPKSWPASFVCHGRCSTCPRMRSGSPGLSSPSRRSTACIDGSRNLSRNGSRKLVFTNHSPFHLCVTFDCHGCTSFVFKCPGI